MITPRGTPPSPPSTASDEAGISAPYLLGATVLAILVLVTEWARLPVPDVSWLLYVTERVAHGAEYGVDIVDVTLPPILWYSLPSVWLKEWLGLSQWHAFMMIVVVTAVASLFLVWDICRRSPAWGPGGARLAVTAAGLALLVLPWGVFGEREHVAIVLVMPYVFLFAARDDATRVPQWLALWVGVFAGLGFAIKPHFVVPWALLTAMALWRRRGVRVPRRAEFLAASTIAALCVLTILCCEIGYTDYMRRYARLYFNYVPQNPVFVSFFGESNSAIVVLLAIVATGALWNCIGIKARPTALYLLVAAVGFHAVAALQLKGWRYHYLPGLALSFVLLVVIMWSTQLPLRRLVARAYKITALVTVTVLLGSAALGSVIRLSRFGGATFDPDFEGLLAVVKEAGGGRPLAVLSANLASAFPLAAEAGVQWSPRYGGLPWLPAFYREQVRAGRVVHHRPYDARSALERSFAQEVVADLRRQTPGLIIVPTPQDGNSFYRLFDYVSYFDDVPGFRALAKQYRPLSCVGAYLVLQHRALPGPFATGRWRRYNPTARGSGLLSEGNKALSLVILAVVVVVAASTLERRRVSSVPE